MNLYQDTEKFSVEKYGSHEFKPMENAKSVVA